MAYNNNKYKNIKVTVDGIRFDSSKEAKRYQDLKLLERAGVISGLRLQVPFELIPKQMKDGKVLERAVTYKADFVYWENGKVVVEDVKGVKTRDYVLKRKLMLYVHGIQIKEI